MRRNIAGIDHCFALVRDLDAARDTYRRLGFTVSPRGTHSAHKGTANHTIMFERDYFELLGVVSPTPANALQRALVAAREGLAAIALRAPNADETVVELRSAGIALGDPLGFSRPVALPDGRTGEAAFRTTQFPDGAAPGFHLFCCQHLTPQTTWLPELLHHDNTVWGLDHLAVLSSQPLEDATILGRLLAETPIGEANAAARVETGTVPVRFLAAGAFAAAYPGIDLADLPPRGLASLALKVHALDTTAAVLAANGVPFVRNGRHLAVGPREACGVLVQFLER
jgi:catechol 2,3-dioxygenase-like lactoylglutathione lyase family enzyme